MRDRPDRSPDEQGEPDPSRAEGSTRDEQEREVAEARREQRGDDPHGDLSNPAEEPDPTEYPDPYEQRSDPRGPDEAGDAAPRGPSTSDPKPPRGHDQQRYEGEEP